MSQDYAKLNVQQLKKLLDDRNINYRGQKKSKLIALLKTHDNEVSVESQESSVEGDAANAFVTRADHASDDDVRDDEVEVVLHSVTANTVKITRIKIAVCN